jgi:hypothetical protein
VNKPQPITDLVAYLRATDRPFTEENIRKTAVMLSMTEGELALALTFVNNPPPLIPGQDPKA